MPKFQFKILRGATESDCRTQYDNIATKDAYTFYLFAKGGIGYFGETPLFGGDASKFNMLSANATYSDLTPNSFYFVTANCTVTDNEDPHVDTHNLTQGSIWITNSSSVPSEISWTNFTNYMARYITNSAIKAANISDASYSGNETSLMTSAAIVKLINEKISSQSILNIQFFKKVELHTITPAEKAAGTKDGVITCFVDYPEVGDSYTVDLTANDHENDIGLVFMVQVGEEYNEPELDGDECVFINLHNLINNYVGSTSDTTEVTVSVDSNDNSGHTQKITVNVNKSTEVFHANGTDNNFETKILTAIRQVTDHMEDSENNPDYNPTATTNNGHGFSPNKFISESQLADILAHLLAHFVQVEYEGPGVTGGTMEEEGGEL